ncbi:oxidoreductase, short-chain dehydrogenase/reductase family [Beauveria bassiana ARSEF 2860]|uniref:Oxidoreductase, short-chain dehydrogenase/reductase family n=1 Tax=Beauveria bassiana (strain ARSEF 2860) TaxID=655819 RepID=J4KRI9_BEAB2|nr:oxidoreductase, short-chain dehydrogenase/reductase family [Beauveria bassiana ARSEF 2860]EJP71034.1 oxidoreductase, short-chain dehydrogenase/reductase family [Beauveria bassiana ARSEF 2860]
MCTFSGYNPDTEIPDLAGKVFLITGGTNGIGKTAVQELAKHNPAHIYFTGRNQQAADALLASLPAGAAATFMPCDMASLASIRQAAASFTSPRLDVFIANAGVMATPPGLTQDGYEYQFGVNHVGNMALLLRLLPVMRATAAAQASSSGDSSSSADVRFVALTSLGYRAHPPAGVELASVRTTQEGFSMGTWARYGQSKLANILTARELARRCPEITCVCVHPGVVKTGLVTELGYWEKMLVYVTNPDGLMTPRQGCYNTVWAATGRGVREAVAEGKVAFFEPVRTPNEGDAKCWDDELAKELWEWTEREVGVRA